MGIARNILMLALVAATGSGAVRAQAFSFYFIEQLAPQTYLGDVAWVDLNDDGLLDLAISGNTGAVDFPAPTFELLAAGAPTKIVGPARATTRIAYEPFASTSTPEIWLGSVAVGDADGDGALDVFASGAAGGPAAWAADATLLRGDGAGRFQAEARAVDPRFAGAALWLDVDNDAREELLITGITAEDAFSTRLYKTGGSTWTAEETAIPGLANAALAAADVDGDGDLDVAASGRTAGGPFLTRILLNEGGRFTESDAELLDVAYGSLDWADYDNDGDPDLLLTGATVGPLALEGTMRVYRNDGGRLVDSGIMLPAIAGGEARWGDYDLDGQSDIAWAGAANVFARPAAGLHRNRGAGVFEHVIVLSGVFPAKVRWGDVESDGDPDLSLQGFGDELLPRFLQYENDQRDANRTPSAPTAPTATVDGRSVTLAWDASTDAETPAEGLTYNLRIGSEPGKSDVLHPRSDARTGRRLQARAGNVWHNQRWMLHDLAPGTYFWSVQAVDASWQGSEFSAEGSFTIGSTGGGQVGTGAETIGDVPQATAIKGNYPNPFREETAILVELARTEHVRLEVYDVLGARVATVHDGVLAAGRYPLQWNGRSDSGETLAAGVYLYRLRTGTARFAGGKMILVR